MTGSESHSAGSGLQGLSLTAEQRREIAALSRRIQGLVDQIDGVDAGGIASGAGDGIAGGAGGGVDGGGAAAVAAAGVAGAGEAAAAESESYQDDLAEWREHLQGSPFFNQEASRPSFDMPAPAKRVNPLRGLLGKR